MGTVSDGPGSERVKPVVDASKLDLTPGIQLNVQRRQMAKKYEIAATLNYKGLTAMGFGHDADQATAQAFRRMAHRLSRA